MEIAPDFFDYFEAAADLLDKDKYVWVKSRLYMLILLKLLQSMSFYFLSSRLNNPW